MPNSGTETDLTENGVPHEHRAYLLYLKTGVKDSTFSPLLSFLLAIPCTPFLWNYSCKAATIPVCRLMWVVPIVVGCKSQPGKNEYSHL